MTRSTTRRIILCLLALALVVAAKGQNELKKYSAKNSAFTLSAPSAFQTITDASAETMIALEVPNFGVSLLATREKAEELEAEKFVPELKKRLIKGGATVLGSAAAKLDGQPAYSFLVGGVKANRESLFVYNMRHDFWYVFVLNYPQGQRKDAADLWKLIAPTIRFKA